MNRSERPHASTRFPVFSWAPTANYFLFIAGFIGANLMSLGKVVPLSILLTLTAVVAINMRALPEIFAKYWIMLLLPVPQILSNFWSPIPVYGFSLSIQLFLTIFLGILMGGLLSPQKLVEVLVISLGIYCLLSVASGNKGPSTEGMVLVGFSGAKNAFGLTAQTLGAAGLTGFLLKDRPTWFRLASLFFAGLGYFLACSVHAATSVLMSAVSVALLVCVMLLATMKLQFRFIVPLFLIMCFLIVLPLLPDIDTLWADLLARFGKDPTLTGRTTLWRVATDWIHAKPVFGHGYRSFWMASSDSLSLLYDNGLSAERAKGFHFHNTALEVQVDTGYFGFSVYLIVMAYFLLLSIRAIFLQPGAISALFSGMFFILMLRAFAETLLLPFSPFLISLMAVMASLVVQWKTREISSPAVVGNRTALFRRRTAANRI